MISKSSLKNANARWYPRRLFYHPEWLVLGVNNVCNLHCKMCDVGLGNNDTVFATNLIGTKPLNMPLELIEQILTDASIHFPQVKIGYAFTEPLVYPHLIKSLVFANELGLYTSMTTNGLTLPQKAESLVAAGLNEINVSLDGPQDVHNEIRGNAKSFQKAVEGLEQLASMPNAPIMSVYCVITEWNIGHLETLANALKHLPLDTLGFMHTNFTTQEIAMAHNAKFGHMYEATTSNLGEINPEAYDLDALWVEMTSVKGKRWPFDIVFSPEVQSKEDLKVFYHAPEVLMGKRCNDAHRNIMIKSDGSVIPAHGRCYNTSFGNVYDQKLSEIWNGAVAAQFRKDLNKAGGLFPACSRCCSAF